MSERVEIGLPEKVVFLDHGDRIEIRRTWLGWDVLFLTAFVIGWDSVAVIRPLINSDANGFMTLFALPFIVA
jgi:hypothetical protein